MTAIHRRGFLALGAAGTVAACSSPPLVKTGTEIEAEVRASRDLLLQTVPGAEALNSRAAGLLIIPEILEGGLFLSGAYGEGGLLIGDALTDYVSMSAAAFGLQIGAQKYSQALFFMTQEALRDFRVTDGWELGVDAEYAVPDEGGAVGASTTTVSRPVIPYIYGQRGLIAGVSLEGAKYSRLIR